MTNYSVLSIYRQLLREVRIQFVARNKNTLWENELKQKFRDNRGITDTELINILTKDAQDVLTFLKSTRKHAELLQLYNPTHGLSQESKLKLTANRVGLTLSDATSSSE
ncbi:10456_t:CDS:2 [Paraglomus brasilianum]|uniref:10456_t:CDS:1 n=1 Tax=Paraglomus brasilianum TaxID=144538 RepID=A0A9N9ABF3_9GLOM|nr:10456_t:CDS:2 [Paraglomus brasilianum]